MESLEFSFFFPRSFSPFSLLSETLSFVLSYVHTRSRAFVKIDSRSFGGTKERRRKEEEKGRGVGVLSSGHPRREARAFIAFPSGVVSYRVYVRGDRYRLAARRSALLLLPCEWIPNLKLVYLTRISEILSRDRSAHALFLFLSLSRLFLIRILTQLAISALLFFSKEGKKGRGCRRH